MIIHREDIACAEMLLKPARRILSEKNAVTRLPLEERIRLWNEIEENYTRFRDGACGKFISDMDNHIRSQFMVSRIILAITFEEHGEPFKPGCICSDRDCEIYRKISRYDMFEILSPADVRKKLELHDDEILTLLSGYYYDMEHWINAVVADPGVDLPIRFFLKKKWKQYRSPIDKALSQNPDRWIHLISRHHEKIQKELDRIKEGIRKRDEEIRTIRNEQKKKEDEIQNLQSIAERLRQDLSEDAEEIETHKKMLEESSKTIAEREQAIEQQKRDFAAREQEHRLVMAGAAENSRELGEKAAEELRELEKRAEEIEGKKQELAASEQQILDEKTRIEAEKTDLNRVITEIARKEQEFREKERALAEKTCELDQIRQKWNTVQESGSRFVRAGEVKQYEMNFIGRIRLKIGGPESRIDISGRPFIVQAVTEPKIAAPEKLREEKPGMTLPADTCALPENRSVVATLLEKRLLGTRARYTFRAQFHSRPAQYARFGFDSEPLSMQDLRPLLAEAQDQARENGTPVVLCLASPTGFASDVSDFLNHADMHRNFLSGDLSVCCVDLETAELIYNPADEVALAFLPWCETVFEQEKIGKARRALRHNIDQQFQQDGFARFDKAEKTCRDSGIADEAIAKAAFYEYGKEKKRAVKHVESVGLVMME